jgi:hypothetical protein
MAWLTTVMFAAVEHLAAVEFAGVVVGDRRVTVRAADCVTEMVAAATFTLA